MSVNARNAWQDPRRMQNCPLWDMSILRLTVHTALSRLASFLAGVVVLVSLASGLLSLAVVNSIIQFLGYPVSCVSPLWRGEACWQKQRVTQ